jgi:outer membrane biosynthesis protein TonB
VNRDWRGMTAFVLALGVAIALVAGFLAAELSPGAVTSEEVSLLSTLGGAAIGAVAAYMGVMHTNPPAQTPSVPPEQPTEGGAVETTPVPEPEPEPTPEPEPEPDPEPSEEEADEMTQGMGPGEGAA